MAMNLSLTGSVRFSVTRASGLLLHSRRSCCSRIGAGRHCLSYRRTSFNIGTQRAFWCTTLFNNGANRKSGYTMQQLLRTTHKRPLSNANGGGGGGGGGGSGGSSNGPDSTIRKMWNQFWEWTTKVREPLPMWSLPWWQDKLIVCTVFAITGSGSVVLVRPAMKSVLGIEGSWKEGPWSYRISSLLICSPVYTLILLVLGTLSGRHTFFANMARKMWGRFLPKSVAAQVGCAPARAKVAQRVVSSAKAASTTTTTTTTTTTAAGSTASTTLGRKGSGGAK